MLFSITSNVVYQIINKKNLYLIKDVNKVKKKKRIQNNLGIF